MNSFGNIFKLTSFGESHGEAVGGVIDGMPAGLKIDIDRIQRELISRLPGQSAIVTNPKERYSFKLVSDLHDGAPPVTSTGFFVFI